MHNHLVIIAGGIGSRFWPMSTTQRPKQFIDVLGCGRTLLQLTLDRFGDICLPSNTWVVTSKQYAHIVHEQLPQLPKSHILLEPCRRNTAPAIAYVAYRIKKEDPKANIVVAPADHLIIHNDEFRRVIKSALDFTAENDSIVTLGIQPTRPETGYGYIQADLSEPCARNREIFRVDAFHEKPDAATAERYIRRKNFFWNSGLFIFRVTTIVNALRIYAPAIANIFEELMPVYDTPDEQTAVDRQFPLCPSISIDYAVMEKAEEIYVFPANFGWSDLGTWGSLHEQAQHDRYDNTAIGNNIQLHDTHDCIIHTTQEQRVIIQGLKGYIVAEKDNCLLICPRDDEQLIRQFVEQDNT